MLQHKEDGIIIPFFRSLLVVIVLDGVSAHNWHGSYKCSKNATINVSCMTALVKIMLLFVVRQRGHPAVLSHTLLEYIWQSTATLSFILKNFCAGRVHREDH